MALTPRSFVRNPILLWLAVLSLGMATYAFGSSSCPSQKTKEIKVVKIKKAKKVQKLSKKQAAMKRAQSKVASSERGWLGVHIQSVNKCTAKKRNLGVNKGVLVLDLQNEMPAQTAGFAKNDVITHFNGKRVTNHSQFTRYVAKTKPNTRVKIKVLRGKTPVTLYPTITSSDHNL